MALLLILILAIPAVGAVANQIVLSSQFNNCEMPCCQGSTEKATSATAVAMAEDHSCCLSEPSFAPLKSSESCDCQYSPAEHPSAIKQDPLIGIAAAVSFFERHEFQIPRAVAFNDEVALIASDSSPPIEIGYESASPRAPPVTGRSATRA